MPGITTADNSTAQLGDRLRRREREIADAIFERVRQVVPDAQRDQDPDRVEAMRATISAALASGLSRIELGESEASDLPAGALLALGWRLEGHLYVNGESSELIQLDRNTVRREHRLNAWPCG